MNDVLVAVPTRGTIGWETVTRLEAIRDEHPGLPPILYQPGNLSVAQTRNRIVKRFLETEHELLFMVDDDVVPPLNLLDLAAVIGDYGVLAIPHPHPAPTDASKLELSVYEETDNGYTFTDVHAGVNACDAVATGCVAIARVVLEKLGPAPFRIAHDPDATITSDDLLFCADVRDAGFRIGYAAGPGWFCDHVSAVNLAPLYEASHSLVAA